MEGQPMDVKTSMQCKLRSLPESSSNRCIYKVPEHIREVNKECYQPWIISIGPIYYNTPSLKSSLEFKLKHLKCFLEHAARTNGKHTDSLLAQYIDIIKDWEEVARSYYEEKISLTSNEFIEMMMVDAAFIIYFFLCFEASQFNVQEKPMSKNMTWIVRIKQDIFVEDNQLPFFVLDNLCNLAFGTTFPRISFKDLTCNFISRGFYLGNDSGRTELGIKNVENNTLEIKHLVDFLRVWHLPSKLRDGKKSTDEYTLPPSAEKLEAAGVKFKAREGKNLLDIEFSDGVLEIPSLSIADTSEALIRNIIFFEQCHHCYDDKSCFVDYIFFLDALIDTREDVEILIKHGIIKHRLGSDVEVANVVNQLCKNIMIHPNFYYYDISEKLNAHANTRINKWMAVLRKDYFNHPWSTISVVYLVILLVLTALQVYTGFIK